MNRARTLGSIAIVAALAVPMTACSSESSGTSPGKAVETTAPLTGTGSAVVNPLFVSRNSAGKSKGGSNVVTIRVAESSDKKLRVGFSEDEVAGSGDQWRAAGWSAVSVATILTGAPLRNRDVQFDITGRIDGPSAGGLMTVGVLSLMRNEKLLDDVTMTGTINPDGTIGPVGGIPYKLDGVIAAKKKRMLIPLGQRNSPNDSGRLVDVVAAGKKKGVKVIEVANVYDAYKAFTNKDLPRPDGEAMSLDEAAYQKLKAKAKTWLARWKSADKELSALDPMFQQLVQELTTEGRTSSELANQLSQQGLQAGSFKTASEAAVFAKAAVGLAQYSETLLTRGPAAFAKRVEAGQAISGEISGLVDGLNAFEPKTVSDAGALIAAYGEAVDAVSYYRFGAGLLDGVAKGRGDTSFEDAVGAALLGASYYELASNSLEVARDVLDVGRDLGGPNLAPGVNLNEIAQFFRRAGEANLEAFDTTVVEPLAESNDMSVASAKAIVFDADSAYALTVTSRDVMAGLDEYFGDVAASDYATLGGSLNLYTRSAELLARYYSLGRVDPDTFELSDVTNQRAFSSTLDFAQSQLEGSVVALREKSVSPSLAVALGESASISREGDTTEKFDALGEYWTAYLETRVLTYLGGFSVV